jgi:Tfp pilus assembly protein PilN
MTTPAYLQKLTAWASDASAVLRQMGKPAWRILNLSLGDDAISWKRTIGISIEKGGVSIVEATRFLSRIRIRNVRRYPFEEGKVATPENVAGIVSLAVRELKVRNAEICLGIPKAWAIIQSADLPASVKETLPDVVSYELDRLTPFNPDEAFYDFRLLQEHPDRLRIVVTAAKADLIRPYVQALGEKRIRLDRVQVNLSGMAALLGFAGQGADSVFLELDNDGYEGALIQNGCLSSVLSGRLEGSDDERIIQRVAEGILPFVDQLKSEGKSPRLFTHLKGRFRDRGYALLEQHATVPCQALSDLDLKLDIPGHREGISYPALGVVLESLWPNAVRMNLLRKGRHRESKRPIAVTAALGLLVLCAGIFYMVSPIGIEGKRLEEIDRQISLRKDEVGKVEAIRKEMDALSKEIASINSIKIGKPMAIDIMKELTDVLPKNVWLARVRITDTGVEIEGYSSGSAAELLPALESSKYLQKVEFSSPTFRDARMNADRFVIKMEIESVNDENKRTETENKK